MPVNPSVMNIYTSVLILACVGLVFLGFIRTVQPQQVGSGSMENDFNCSNITQYGEIRLVNGRTMFEGRVEVCYMSQWRTVSGETYDWSTNNSRVVCRQFLEQLGEEFNGAITRNSQYFGSGSQEQLVYRIRKVCDENETKFISCASSGTMGSIDHFYDIGVTCIPSNTSLVQECVPPTTTPDQFQCQNGYCLRVTSSSTFPTPSSSLIGGPPGVCDSSGNDDCGDCSDECHCNYRLGSEGQYHCRSQPTTVCICSDSEFQCSNGFCTDMSNYCDGYDNCGDASDELDEECREQRSRNIGKTELGITLGVSIGGAVIIVLIWLAVFGVCMFIRPCPLRKAFSEEPIIPVESETDGSQTQGTELSST